MINLTFPDETYSSANKPSAETIKDDFNILENEVNSHDTRINSLENAPAPTKTIPVPAGAVTMFAGNDLPQNYLWCDGSEVSRTTFSDLFDAIGTTYGAGDGSTTFNLPVFENLAPVGVGELALGQTGGNKEHALSEDEMPKHKHDVDVSASASVNDPKHKHSAGTFLAYTAGGGTKDDFGDGWQEVNKDTTEVATGISVSVSTTTTENEKGNNQAFNIEGRRVGINFIIKANND